VNYCFFKNKKLKARNKFSKKQSKRKQKNLFKTLSPLSKVYPPKETKEKEPVVEVPEPASVPILQTAKSSSSATKDKK